ncbi:MAG: KpsF/GutQ family sugar-phosphate isomerase [Desulfococcaceae bacterium]|jgi:arabinose-5-phosphate isomerase|nr:KpsF/GutQ family sugar-phosphate isomerase [Desulfococcaceae bacterium]
MILEQAKEVLRTEARGILELRDRLDDNFRHMTELICNSSGRLIVAGIGKSGIIGRKFVATFNSTGTRSFFLHPVEAMHGDLGMVCPDDILLALSNSGETDELNILLPSIRSIGCKIIAFTGKADSTLARNSDIVINVGVKKEACPMGLAPTTSTTALLAMGDALAVVLIHCKNFKSGDFKKIHPGGALGQRLSKKVEDFMLADDTLPLVKEDMNMKETVAAMDRVSLGVALVIKPDRTLSGIITDGDIRRMLAKQLFFPEQKAGEVMTPNPKFVRLETPAYDALNLMESFEITVLPVCSTGGVVLGIIHLHDILGKGEFKFRGQ